jgi:hypothetical protein
MLKILAELGSGITTKLENNPNSRVHVLYGLHLDGPLEIAHLGAAEGQGIGLIAAQVKRPMPLHRPFIGSVNQGRGQAVAYIVGPLLAHVISQLLAHGERVNHARYKSQRH